MECFGFNPTEILINVKRGYIEVSVNHKEFDKPTYNDCSSFWLPCEDGTVYTYDRTYVCKHVQWKLMNAPKFVKELGRMTPKEYEEIQYASFIFF